MYPLRLLIGTGVFGSLLTGCVNINESLWHALTSLDANVNPTLESPRPSDTVGSYSDYAAKRKSALNDK